MQIKKGVTYRPLITIEVKHKTICQISGHRNRRVNEIELEIIQEWSNICGFELTADNFLTH